MSTLRFKREKTCRDRKWNVDLRKKGMHKRKKRARRPRQGELLSEKGIYLRNLLIPDRRSSTWSCTTG